MCVQNLDDSRGFAIRITYRISLRSSSLWEPRHPLLKVVFHYQFYRVHTINVSLLHTPKLIAFYSFLQDLFNPLTFTLTFSLTLISSIKRRVEQNIEIRWYGDVNNDIAL